MKRAIVGFGVFVVTAGCGAAVPQQTPAAVPRATAATPPTGPAAHAALGERQDDARIWALPTGPRDSGPPVEPKAIRTDAWAKAAKVKGLPSAPASCALYGKPTPAKPTPTDLASVFAEKDPAKQTSKLAAFESKADVADTIRAMRAYLAPIECADTVTDPFLSSTSNVNGMAGQLTVGISLASKLARTAATPPVLKETSEKEKVKRFIQGPLRQWMVEQASAIDALSTPASELVGFARGVVAIEAGMADLRLVDRIRSAPTPRSWDAELKAVYEAALDEALEPRKARGRDAALVGLADFAAAGIVYDARTDRTRALLSKLYGGRRIDALDALLLPPGEAKPVPNHEAALALLPAEPAQREWFAQMGLAAPKAAKVARERLELGRRSWRRVDFVEAAHAASAGAADDAKADPAPRLVLALALALAKGPASAKEMMTAPSPSALGLSNTEALDALAGERSPVAGMAAFDAAYLRSLCPPEGEAAGPYLADVAARFRKAAGLLEDSAQKKRAEGLAADAETASKAATEPKPKSQ